METVKRPLTSAGKGLFLFLEYNYMSQKTPNYRRADELAP
jgi:hypothetical protein